jgi:hypothetical protein
VKKITISLLKLLGVRVLFADSEKAALNAGNLYSLLAAAKAHGLKPVEYLFDLIEIIPSQPINQIEELLPNRWQPNPDLAEWLAWTPKESDDIR